MPQKEGCLKQKTRAAIKKKETINTAQGKEADIMKGLEIAVLIIGCGIKILEVLEEN